MYAGGLRWTSFFLLNWLALGCILGCWFDQAVGLMNRVGIVLCYLFVCVGIFQWATVAFGKCFFDFWFCASPCQRDRGCPGILLSPCVVCSSSSVRFERGRPQSKLFGVARWPAHVAGKVDFSLGVCNVNGIYDKASCLDSLNVDLLAISETHLSEGGVRSFRNILKLQAPGCGWFKHGKPVLPRGQVSDVGLWAGVGILSRWPTHGLPHAWDPLLYNTGRICITSTFVHGLWVSGCVIYGPPTGQTHSNAKVKTNALIRAGLERVLQLSGPRFLGGDFNHDLASLEVWKK